MTKRVERIHSIPRITQKSKFCLCSNIQLVVVFESVGGTVGLVQGAYPEHTYLEEPISGVYIRSPERVLNKNQRARGVSWTHTSTVPK